MLTLPKYNLNTSKDLIFHGIYISKQLDTTDPLKDMQKHIKKQLWLQE